MQITCQLDIIINLIEKQCYLPTSVRNENHGHMLHGYVLQDIAIHPHKVIVVSSTSGRSHFSSNELVISANRSCDRSFLFRRELAMCWKMEILLSNKGEFNNNQSAWQRMPRISLSVILKARVDELVIDQITLKTGFGWGAGTHPRLDQLHWPKIIWKQSVIIDLIYIAVTILRNFKRIVRVKTAVLILVLVLFPDSLLTWKRIKK